MDRRPAISAKKSRDIERTIYTDWANHHLEKTGVKRLIQDLPKDIGDGLLLADIVHFVCEEPVDRIHANPSTAKQKIYNIERCLQILQTHKVVLNDVTALGLYRGELKSVLALFFHLSRFKQKSQDFKMADVANNCVSNSSIRRAKRTGLRPPSAVSVSRKSRSFNANDKNRINVDAASNGSATRLSPTSPINVFNGVSPHSKISEPSAASPWRSKSMSAKHSATTRLLAPKAHAPTLQTFKPTMTSQSNPSSSAASVTSESSEMDTKQNTTRPTSPLRQQRTSQRATNASRLEVRTKNVGIPQKSAIAKPVSRVAGNSPKRTLTPRSNLSKRPTEPPAKEPTTQKPASVMSRLKKLGSVTTATTTATTSAKTRSTSASKNVTSVTSAAKKRAESCPPTSRIATTAIKRPTQLQQKPTPEEKASTKKPGTSPARKPLGKSGTGLKGVKSSIGKAFSSKQTEKKSPKTQSPDSTSSKQGFMKKLSDSKSEKPRPTISDPIPIVTPDPIFGSTTPSKPPTPPAPPTPQPLEGVEEHSKSEDTYEKPVEPVSISLGSPRVTNKPHKTATVAPFLRHPAKQSVPPTPPKRNSVTEEMTPDKKVQSTELTATTPEDARNKAVKGIADLRHNLEATMCSLRNTQLRHRKDDALQRRISAQLDGGEFDELSKTIPEIPSPSAAVYRSHHNLLSCRTSPRNSIISRSPKLHAGETLAQPREYRFEPGRFSSLQRTRSARYPRSAWRDVTAGYVSEGDVLATPENESKGYVSDGAILNDLESPQKHWDIPDSIDDASSVSSCDISDCIADVSTDELSSANNSPFRFNKQKDDRSGTISNEFSQSTMAIEGNKSQKTKKRGFGRPPTGKLGIKTPGSSVVGSRLACNTLSSSPAQSLLGQRGSLAYRSLPRPSKSNLTPDKTHHSPLTNGTLGRDNSGKGGETFKRSPSLQKLLGLASRKPSTCTTSSTISNPHVTFSQPSTYIDVTSSVTSLVTSSMAPSHNSYTTPNKMELNSYNSLGRPRTASPRNGNISTSPLSYMSLPRRSSSRTPTMTSSGYHSNGGSNGMSTWSSPKRQNPNSAYSINPAENNPYSSMDLLTTPSLYLDDKNTDIYLDQDLRKKADDVAYGRSGVSDWPLPALLTTSSTLTSSSPNVSRAISLKSQETSKDFRHRQGSMFSLSERKQESHGNRPPSVISNAPSLYSLEEEGIEPMKLKLDSINGNGSIKNHLTTNAKVVSAFEESLSTMTNRLKELSATAVQKDSELQELRQTIENLKRNHSPDEWSGNQTNLKKKASCGSLSSISSKTSVSSIGSTEDGKRKKKHWAKETGEKLRDSIKTAFGKRKSRPNLAAEMEEMESIATIAIPEHMDDDDNETVAKLREELLQKERKLTDIRLEALTSQHQLHQMQDAMQRMRSEMETLRQENERLNKLGLSTMSLDMVSPSSEQRCIGSEPLRRVDHCDVRMRVMVEYPTHMTPDDTDERTHPSILGICYVPRSTGWCQLDEKVQLVFQEYCRKIDPIGGFGIHPDCVHAYTVGGAERVIGGEAPTLLPCGYIVGEVDTITLKLSELESVALDLLVDRDVLDRYTRLILEHGRVMICGPSGTGKSTLANRLAEHIVRNVPKRSSKCPIVHLDLKHTSENEIRDYLHGVSENCSKPESSGREVPAVIVFDNLHRSSAVNEAFHPLLTATTHTQLPYLIGVIQQGFASGLQLHHEFKWILCSNHTPPVHEYLTRALRRTLHSWELSNAVVADDSMVGIVKWLPQCWERVNNCIEAHSSADVTLGPRIFSSCPMDPHSSYTWFTDIWNFTIVPYVISAVRQRKLTTAPQWSDPLIWVKESWPWATPCDLLPIRVEDVSSDPPLAVSDNSTTVTTQSSDPLLNMLLRLQEAAAMNYESDASHDDAFELSLDRALGDLA